MSENAVPISSKRIYTGIYRDTIPPQRLDSGCADSAASSAVIVTSLITSDYFALIVQGIFQNLQG